MSSMRTKMNPTTITSPFGSTKYNGKKDSSAHNSVMDQAHYLKAVNEVNEAG
jgi:hypothetical protein